MTMGVHAANSRSPALSLILCARNDRYLGDSVWRLGTALNYVAEKVSELGREGDVEVLVTDWGSRTPLAQVLELTPAASKLVSFLVVPPEIADTLQKDSPFAEVLALNASARRANGEYIGRIDQDTLVGKRFLQTFFQLLEGVAKVEVPLASALLFSGRRDIPYRWAVRRPPLWVVDRFIERRGARTPVENTRLSIPFYQKGVGIWLLHRSLWHECGGFDERMIYMNSMEINMMHRLMKKYPMVDLGRLVDYDFYHLEHYHPWRERKTSTHRRVNPRLFWEPDVMAPNGEAWGLAEYPLAVVRCTTARSAPRRLRPDVRFLFVGPLVQAQTAFDRLIRSFGVWWPRARRACEAVVVGERE